MIGIGVGIRPKYYNSIDADAALFISALAADGYPLEAPEQTYINTLVTDFKSAGIWSKMKAIYPYCTSQRNLIGYSEDFSNAYWNKFSTTVTSNATIAPDGTMSADALYESNVLNFHGFENAAAYSIVNGVTYTQSLYVKPIDRRYIALTTQWAGGTVGAWFDTQTVTVFSYDTGITANITTSNNGFYRISITRNSPSTTNGYTNVWFDDSTPSAGVYFTGNTYLGDITKGYYIWGAQFEIGSTATTYQPVATTASTIFASQFKYNLKDPRNLDAAFRQVFNGGWTYSKQGATPNGTNGYADTKLNDLSIMSDSSNSLGFYSRTNNYLSNCNDIGAYDGTMFTGLRFNNNNTTSFAHNGQDGLSGAAILFTSTLSSAAFLTQTRTSLTSFKFIRNGVVLASTTNTKTGTNANQTFYIGAAHGTSGGQQYSNREFAFSYFSDGLTDTQASNLYTAVQNFQVSMQRQV